MGLITGIISDKNGKALNDVQVSLMNNSFEKVISTMTNKNGEYSLTHQDDYYPFMIAVKDYKKNYLEFWCQNINTTKDIVINGSIDKLEIYGLHCFRILGAYPALTIYFRPMSLDKYKSYTKGELESADISPNMTNDSIKASINNVKSQILKVNKVEEYGGKMNMTAYIMQISLPEKLLNENENLLDVQMLDLDGSFGQASIFF